MSFLSPWENDVAVVRHHYYDQKPHFEREVDEYEEWSMFAVERGRFQYRIAKAEGEASSGQMVLCPPGIAFYRYNQEPVSFHYFLFHWIDKNNKPISSSGYRFGTIMRLQNTERFYSSLSTLRSPTLAQHPTYRLWRNHILLDLLRCYVMENAQPAWQDRTREHDPQMERARLMLDAVCDEPITISEVARACSLNNVQFMRRFRQAYGLTPSAYVEKVKLDKVCHLLTHTAMTIEQIAQASGFSNGFYLSRYFSIKMHMPPSAYRNHNRV